MRPDLDIWHGGAITVDSKLTARQTVPYVGAGPLPHAERYVINNILAVGAGGFLGSAARYLVSLGLVRVPDGLAFPFGTAAVNMVGCLAIGFLAGMWETAPGGAPETLRLFLVVGVLGGFTTFSAFGLESFQLFRSGATGLWLLNAVGQVVLGMAAVWFGLTIGKGWGG